MLRENYSWCWAGVLSPSSCSPGCGRGSTWGRPAHQRRWGHRAQPSPQMECASSEVLQMFQISNKSTITIHNKQELVFKIKINSTKVWSQTTFASRSFSLYSAAFFIRKNISLFWKIYQCLFFNKQTSKSEGPHSSHRTLIWFNIPLLYCPTLLHVQEREWPGRDENLLFWINKQIYHWRIC